MHRVAHEVIAGPGYSLLSFVLRKIMVKLPVKLEITPTVNSPFLVCESKGKLVPIAEVIHDIDG